MEKVNRLTINGFEFAFEEGDTILDVARRSGVYIPTLCHLNGTVHTGACRVCLVEVEGARGLAAACAMPAAPDMKVQTESPKVVEARRFVIALLMVSGNHNCAARGASDEDWTDFQLGVRDYDHATDICDAYGECELQALAYRYQVSDLVAELRLRSLKTKYPLEEASPFILRDFSRCILCGRCVKACNEIAFNGAISFGYRGTEAKIVTRGDSPLADSDCVFCGECIQRCPVGALVEKDSRFEARAWELQRVRTTCGYCATGCSIDLFVKDGKVVKASGTESGVVNRGSLCIRGRYGNDFIGHPDRLRQPLVREGGVQRPAEWDEALKLVAGKLEEIRDAHGPDAVAGFASTRISNEDAYVMQKFLRGCVGTRNVDNASRLLDGPTMAGLDAAFGVPAMTNSIGEIDTTDLILLIGSDPTREHPVVATRIKRAVRKTDTTLILVDPGAGDMAPHADIHLRPLPGTDVAWCNGFLHVILEENLFNAPGVGNKAGFAELRELVKKYTPEHVEKITGIERDQLVDAARRYAGAGRASIYYGNGITQHVAGTDAVKSLANLALLCENIGVEGGGLNPLRSQCNAQGVCDMGCLPDFHPAAKTPEGPAGLRFTEVIEGIETGRIKALFVVGEDPLASLPNAAAVEDALKKLDLLVVQDIFASATSRAAHVVLPSVSFAEKEGTFTNTERRVQRIRKAVDPPGGAREDWRIFVGLSSLMGPEINYGSASEIFDEIAKATPDYGGMSFARIDKEGGLQWPCPDAGHPGTRTLHADDVDGRVRFLPVEYSDPAEMPDSEYPYLLITGHVLRHYYHQSRVKDFLPGNTVEISAPDAMKLKLKDNDSIRITSRRGAVEVPVRISHRFPEGIVYAPLQFGAAGLNNVLTTAADSGSGTPAYKVCAVKLSD